MAEETLEETNEEIPIDESAKLTGIKKLLANKIIVIAAAVTLVLILAVGAYFLFFSGGEEVPKLDGENEETTEESAPFSLEEAEKIEIDIAPNEGETALTPATEDVAPEEDDSELALISNLMKKNAPKPSKDEESNSDSNDEKASPANAKILKELEALKKQNAELKLYIKDRDKKEKMSEKDLSVPIDRMMKQLPATEETKEKPKPIQDNPYMYLDDFDESSNYYSSPYADDEQVPEPTWGD